MVSTILKLLLLLFTVHKCDSAFNVTELVNTLLNGYDKGVRPNFGGSKVNVGVTLYILDISGVSEKNMEFTVQMYFRQFWRDDRLQFTPKQAGLSSIVLSPSNRIWVPDTFFTNAQSSSFHYATQPNVFTKLNSDGNIIHSVRLTVTLKCPMDFSLFPMDTQSCVIEMESYGFKADEISYTFHKGQGSVGISPEVGNLPLRVLGYRLKEQTIVLSTGNYSRILVQVLFKRYVRSYLLDMYLPAALVVIVSWIGFWLSINKTARISLGLISTFIILHLLQRVNKQLPRLNYSTAIEVYVLSCLVMVILSLVEFIVVYFLHNEEFDNKKLADTELGRKCQTFVCNLDKYSKIAFPLLFVLFNLLYWIIMMSVCDVEVSNLVSFN